MKRRLAKALFWVSAPLRLVKTPRRTFRAASTQPWVTEPAGWRWLPCRLSMRLLKWSMKLDWDHWDHWAQVHTNCDPTPCPECGGYQCTEEEL